MKTNLTEIVFILDRSGSMRFLTKDTIGGFNSFIENQKKEEGEALVTTILFDDKYEILHNGINIENITPLTGKEYSARGMTALLDAVGKSINDVGDRLNRTEESERPSKVIFVITTDGQENSSKEFNREQIKEMITRQTDKYNWQFMFLGANIDAVGEAASLGINPVFASNYVASPVGTDSLYATLSKTVSNYRSVGSVDCNWNVDLK